MAEVEVNWEPIEPHLMRAKIPGGWLVMLKELHHESGAGGLTFVPDPEHEWV